MQRMLLSLQLFALIVYVAAYATPDLALPLIIEKIDHMTSFELLNGEAQEGDDAFLSPDISHLLQFIQSLGDDAIKFQGRIDLGIYGNTKSTMELQKVSKDLTELEGRGSIPGTSKVEDVETYLSNEDTSRSLLEQVLSITHPLPSAPKQHSPSVSGPLETSIAQGSNERPDAGDIEPALQLNKGRRITIKTEKQIDSMKQVTTIPKAINDKDKTPTLERTSALYQSSLSPSPSHDLQEDALQPHFTLSEQEILGIGSSQVPPLHLAQPTQISSQAPLPLPFDSQHATSAVAPNTVNNTFSVPNFLSQLPTKPLQPTEGLTALNEHNIKSSIEHYLKLRLDNLLRNIVPSDNRGLIDRSSQVGPPPELRSRASDIVSTPIPYTHHLATTPPPKSLDLTEITIGQIKESLKGGFSDLNVERLRKVLTSVLDGMAAVPSKDEKREGTKIPNNQLITDEQSWIETKNATRTNSGIKSENLIDKKMVTLNPKEIATRELKRLEMLINILESFTDSFDTQRLHEKNQKQLKKAQAHLGRLRDIPGDVLDILFTTDERQTWDHLMHKSSLKKIELDVKNLDDEKLKKHSEGENINSQTVQEGLIEHDYPLNNKYSIGSDQEAITSFETINAIPEDSKQFINEVDKSEEYKFRSVVPKERPHRKNPKSKSKNRSRSRSKINSSKRKDPQEMHSRKNIGMNNSGWKVKVLPNDSNQVRKNWKPSNRTAKNSSIFELAFEEQKNPGINDTAHPFERENNTLSELLKKHSSLNSASEFSKKNQISTVVPVPTSTLTSKNKDSNVVTDSIRAEKIAFDRLKNNPSLLFTGARLEPKNGEPEYSDHDMFDFTKSSVAGQQSPPLSSTMIWFGIFFFVAFILC